MMPTGTPSGDPRRNEDAIEGTDASAKPASTSTADFTLRRVFIGSSSNIATQKAELFLDDEQRCDRTRLRYRILRLTHVRVDAQKQSMVPVKRIGPITHLSPPSC